MGENDFRRNEKSKLVPGVGRIPFPAYHGKDPYIFISYAHVDHDRVFSMIKEYYDRGYNIWYDEGIAPGNEWTADIAKALKECALFLVMITPNSVASGNCKNEINFAISKKKPFIAIHLEPTTLPDDLELQIGMKQAILMHSMTHEEYVYKYTNAFERFGIRPDEKVAEKRKAEGVSFETGEEAGKEEEGKKKPILLAAAGVVAVGVIAAALMMPHGTATKKAEDTGQKIEVTYETDSGDSGQDTGSTESAATTAAVTGTQKDSPGAEDYLYSEKYDGIMLDKYGGSGQKVIEVPAVIDGQPVTGIGDNCFEDCHDIEEVVLPETVTKIKYRAFQGCTKLTKINIPKSLETVGGWSFAHTGLKEMIFPDTLKSFEYGAFNSCSKLENVVLPASITFIDKDTFRGCYKLTRVTIPAMEAEINATAFEEESRDLTLCAPKGSQAEKYAHIMGFSFEEYK